VEPSLLLLLVGRMLFWLRSSQRRGCVLFVDNQLVSEQSLVSARVCGGHYDPVPWRLV
jgi:hypothetical protein